MVAHRVPALPRKPMLAPDNVKKSPRAPGTDQNTVHIAWSVYPFLSHDPQGPPMRRRPYRREKGQKLTLADHLAIDRTILSNERTGLAYGRTSLAMLVVGGTLLKFFDSWYMWALGVLFIAGSIFVAVRGVIRYRETAKYLAAALEERTGDPEHPLRETVKESPKESQSKDSPKQLTSKDVSEDDSASRSSTATAATTRE